MVSINLSKFPFDINQETNYYCIPAGILSILKYYDDEIKITQDELFKLMSPDISFGAVKKLTFKDFTFDIKYPETNCFTKQCFSNWFKIIKDEIDQSKPVAISFRLDSRNVHTKVAVAYDTSNLWLFDPAPFTQRPVQYSFQDAEKEFAKQDRCGDMIIVNYHG